MTLTRHHTGLRAYQQEAMDSLMKKQFNRAVNLAEVRQQSQVDLARISELRAQQVFRRQTNPCPGGAC